MSISDVLDDNIEEDKHQSIAVGQSISSMFEYNRIIPIFELLLDRNNFIPFYQSNTATEENVPLRRMTTTDSFPLTPEKSKEIIPLPPPAAPAKRTLFKLSLIKCLSFLFFLQLLLLIIYLWIFIRKKPSLNHLENRYHRGEFQSHIRTH